MRQKEICRQYYFFRTSGSDKRKAQAEVDKYRESIGLIEDVSVAEPIGVGVCTAKCCCS